MGLLARECGWSHDYIGDNFTAQQIREYCEIIQRQKAREHQINAICMVYAMATAFGTMKFNDFRRFLDKLDIDKEKVDSVLKRAKAAGLPTEEK